MCLMLNQLGASVDSFQPRGWRSEGVNLATGVSHMETLDSALSKAKMPPGWVLWLVELGAAADPHTQVWGSKGGCEDTQNAETGGGSSP